MSSGWCINPDCAHPNQPGTSEACQWCGTAILLENRYYIHRPLQLSRHPLSPTAVFEVVDRLSDGKAKVLKVLCEPSRARIARLEQEYNALTLLDAPGQIPRGDLDGFFSVPIDSQRLYCLVMEKIEGQPLHEWLEAGNQLSQEMALNWLRQLINLIAIVHGRLYFHRDIKPDNLILRSDGRLALIDFGACRRISDTYLVKLKVGESPHYVSSQAFYSITAVGSAGYSPLEQLHGRSVPQSDFFAIARTLVHLMTGKHPATLPLDKTGKLLWQAQANRVAPPFAAFIDELQSPAWIERPANTEVILQRLKQLPRHIRRYQLLTAPQVRVGVILAGTLAATSCVWGMNAWAVYHQLSQARQYADQGARHQLNGQIDAARQNYQRALELDPALPEVHQNLALLCQGERNFPCAIDHYKQALNFAPDNLQAHYNLGNLYDEQGEYDKATASYERAMSSKQRLGVDAANNLSRLKNLQGEYSAAATLATQVLQRTSDPISQAALLKNLGWAYLEQVRYEDALKSLQQAQALDAQQPETARRADIYCLLAQTQEGLGLPIKAKQSWKSCLRYESTSTLPEVRGWREEILKRVLSN